MSSAYYALVFGIDLSTLLFCQILLIRLYLRTHINNLWLFTLKKSKFAKFKADFFVILRIFDFECLCHASVKIEIVMFGFVFMEVRKLRSLYRENKEDNLHKT